MSANKYNTHLKVGDEAPIIEAMDQAGLLLNSTDLLEMGKLAVVFYRGVWCPFCNDHLKQVENDFIAFLSNGRRLMLVTPEQPPFIKKMVENASAHYPIISDREYKIMIDYGVAFEVTKENYKDFFSKESQMEIIKEHNDDKEKLILPIPATFLINQNNKIEHIHFNVNFKKRMTAKDILNK